MFIPKILVIDDEPLMRISLTDSLKGKGYLVESASSGEQALQLLRSGQYDIVITDLRLPQYDGMAILKECKKISPDTEVILITAYATVESAVEAMKRGAYDYITKPFHLEELGKIIDRLLWEKKTTRGKSALPDPATAGIGRGESPHEKGI